MRYAQLLNDVCIFCSLLFICYFAKYRFNPPFHFSSQFFVYFLRSIIRTYYSISVCQCKTNEEVQSLVDRSILFLSFVKILLFLSFSLEASSKCVNRQNSFALSFLHFPRNLHNPSNCSRVDSIVILITPFPVLLSFPPSSALRSSRRRYFPLSIFQLPSSRFCRCFYVVSNHLLVVSITVLPSLGPH